MVVGVEKIASYSGVFRVMSNSSSRLRFFGDGMGGCSLVADGIAVSSRGEGGYGQGKASLP